MRNKNSMRTLLKERSVWVAAGIFVFILALVLFLNPPTATSQTSSAPITGWAWSDTVGWVDFNCSNRGTCGSVNFGVIVNANGTLSGHAWSENVGWISANSSDLSGCPQSPCTARFQNGQLLGWMRALSGGSAQSGGWDGFIALSDTNTGDGITYGVSADQDGDFSGYAWGSTVMGWLGFSTSYGTVHTDYQQCTPQYFCADGPDVDVALDDKFYRSAICEETLEEECTYGCANGGCFPPPLPAPPPGEDALELVPSVIQGGQTITATWLIEDADSCTITINGVTWLADVSSSGSDVSDPILESSTFEITCTGPGGSYNETQEVIVSPIWQEV